MTELQILSFTFRYVDAITLTAESEEELKRFLMRVKEESENAGLKLNIKITKIMVLSFLYSTAPTSHFFLDSHLLF